MGRTWTFLLDFKIYKDVKGLRYIFIYFYLYTDIKIHSWWTNSPDLKFQEDGVRFFSGVPCSRKRGKAHKLKHRKLHLNMRRSFVPLKVTELEQAAQKGWGVSISGDTKNLHGLNSVQGFSRSGELDWIIYKGSFQPRSLCDFEGGICELQKMWNLARAEIPGGRIQLCKTRGQSCPGRGVHPPFLEVFST